MTGNPKAISWFLLVSFFMPLLACDAATSATHNNEVGRNQAQSRARAEKKALIYDGEAAAYGDVDAIVGILDEQGISYKRVSSDELDEMSVEQIAAHDMIIWPGGYAGMMSNSLNQKTRDRLKEAVTVAGVSFVGICAGAFIAVSPDTTWGLSLIKGETLPYYYLEDEGTESAMVTVRFHGNRKRDLVWWGGPTLPEYPGGVVARYEQNQKPAIIQTMAGRGFVILTGPHPEAPEDWRTNLDLEDSDGLDHELAATLFRAALKRRPLPTV